MSDPQPSGRRVLPAVWLAVLGVILAGPPLYAALGLWGLVVGQLGWILLPSLLVARAQSRGLGLVPAEVGRFVAAILCGWSLARLVSLLLGWQQRWLPLPEQLEQAYRRLGEHAADQPLLALAALALLPAVCEELLFRGLVLRALARSHGARLALLASTGLFMLVHLDPYKLAATGVAGLVLGALALRSGSVLPSMLLHLCYNATLLLWGYTALPVPGVELPVFALGLWLALRPGGGSRGWGLSR